MKMFRGMEQGHLARRLVLRGWPEQAAAKMAEFMCGGEVVPRWQDLQPAPKEGSDDARA